MKKERKLTDGEIQLGKMGIITDAAVSVVNNMVKWGGLLGISYFVYRTIQSIAGQQTVANIAINLISDLKINQWIAYVIGISGIGYGCMQKRIKKITIEHLSRRKEELETMLDNRRTSSMLTRRGETNPEDMP